MRSKRQSFFPRLAFNFLTATISLVFAGCSTLQPPPPLPDPASAQAITVKLSDHSSLSFSDAQRAQQVAELIAQYDNWGSSWLSKPHPRYRLVIDYADGSQATFLINKESIARGENGSRARALSKAQLQELDRAILGDNPYQRFHTLALDDA